MQQQQPQPQQMTLQQLQQAVVGLRRELAQEQRQRQELERRVAVLEGGRKTERETETEAARETARETASSSLVSVPVPAPSASAAASASEVVLIPPAASVSPARLQSQPAGPGYKSSVAAVALPPTASSSSSSSSPPSQPPAPAPVDDILASEPFLPWVDIFKAEFPGYISSLKPTDKAGIEAQLREIVAADLGIPLERVPEVPSSSRVGRGTARSVVACPVRLRERLVDMCFERQDRGLIRMLTLPAKRKKGASDDSGRVGPNGDGGAGSGSESGGGDGADGGDKQKRKKARRPKTGGSDDVDNHDAKAEDGEPSFAEDWRTAWAPPPRRATLVASAISSGSGSRVHQSAKQQRRSAGARMVVDRDASSSVPAASVSSQPSASVAVPTTTSSATANNSTSNNSTSMAPPAIPNINAPVSNVAAAPSTDDDRSSVRSSESPEKVAPPRKAMTYQSLFAELRPNWRNMYTNDERQGLKNLIIKWMTEQMTSSERRLGLVTLVGGERKNGVPPHRHEDFKQYFDRILRVDNSGGAAGSVSGQQKSNGMGGNGGRAAGFGSRSAVMGDGSRNGSGVNGSVAPPQPVNSTTTGVPSAGFGGLPSGGSVGGNTSSTFSAAAGFGESSSSTSSTGQPVGFRDAPSASGSLNAGSAAVPSAAIASAAEAGEAAQQLTKQQQQNQADVVMTEVVANATVFVHEAKDREGGGGGAGAVAGGNGGVGGGVIEAELRMQVERLEASAAGGLMEAIVAGF